MRTVSLDEAEAGAVIASEVSGKYRNQDYTIVPVGTVLTAGLIARLKDKGIGYVTIEGDPPASEKGKKPSLKQTNERTSSIDTKSLPSELHDSSMEIWNKNESIRREHMNRALSELSSIFECNEEIKKLSQSAVKSIDRIADDILEDLGNNTSYLGYQMTALQDYDNYTYKHCLRVAMISLGICKEMKFTQAQIKEVLISALLHDIGKSNIDHNIVGKTSKLTDEEFTEIKKHPRLGYEILKNSGCYSENVLAGVLFHQEKYDGSGYPLKLKKDKIPLIARILAVADVFDALTSERPYRDPWSMTETEEYMFGGCETHFDYDVVCAFLRAYNPYPIGKSVTLSNGDCGIVVAHNPNVLRPVIDVHGKKVDLTNDYRYLSVIITG